MGLNPEQNFLRENTYAETPLSAAEEELLVGKRKKEFVDPLHDDAQDPENFIDDPYKAEEVKRDLDYVTRREASIKKQRHDRALLGEAVLYYLMGRKNLLGKQIEAIPGTRYDDLANGIDMVLEIAGGEKPLWLAVDTTVGNPDVVGAKIEKIEEDLRQERLGEVKYFQSETKPEYKQRIKIPKIVLSLNRVDLSETAAMLCAGGTNKILLKKLEDSFRAQINEQLRKAEQIIIGLGPINDKRRGFINNFRALRQSISPNS